MREMRGPHHSSKRTGDCQLALCAPGTSPCSMCVRVAPSLAHSFIRRCLHCALVMMLLRGTISPDIAMCKNGLGVECNCLYALPFVFASVAFPTGKKPAYFFWRKYCKYGNGHACMHTSHYMPARLIMVPCPAQHILKSAAGGSVAKAHP